MDRRDFLRSAGVASAAAALPGLSRGRAQSSPADGWRNFEVTTTVEVLKPAGTTRVWLPTPLISDTPYQRSLGNTFHAEGGKTSVKNEASSATGIVAAEWPAGVRPVLTMTSRVSTRDYTADL